MSATQAGHDPQKGAQQQQQARAAGDEHERARHSGSSDDVEDSHSAWTQARQDAFDDIQFRNHQRRRKLGHFVEDRKQRHHAKHHTQADGETRKAEDGAGTSSKTGLGEYKPEVKWSKRTGDAVRTIVSDERDALNASASSFRASPRPVDQRPGGQLASVTQCEVCGGSISIAGGKLHSINLPP